MHAQHYVSLVFSNWSRLPGNVLMAVQGLDWQRSSAVGALRTIAEAAKVT